MIIKTVAKFLFKNFQLQPTDKLKPQADIIKGRLDQVNKICRQTNNTSGLVTEILGDHKLHLAYCVVPKAGCTMWLRLTHFYAGQGVPYAGPMSLSKYNIHIDGGEFHKQISLCHDAAFISKSLRSMTVRDPYTRLWSAYIDKLLLPDFWTTKGKMIVSMLRPGASNKSLQCGHDVSFPEFIQYVVATGHDQASWDQDKHWLPASDICDPCVFKPDVIGKQESFMDDFKYTVGRMGKPDTIDLVKTNDPDDFEIEDEVDYNFKIHHLHEGCVDELELCRRMWKAFHHNGYIPPSEGFDDYIKGSSISKREFLFVIRAIRQAFRVTKDDKKRWRMNAIQQGFSDIPEEQKEALSKLYQLDFEMFGYDSKPDYVFSGTHNSTFHA